MTVLYISGPMTGKPDWGFPQFNHAADRLKRAGWEVVNPADHGSGESWETYIRRDIAQLLDCDAIVLLPGWEESRGANLEKLVAEAIGIKVYHFIEASESSTDPYACLAGKGETILEEAQRLIHGDRQNDYGHPLDDFQKTAGQWHSLFGWDTSPEKVAMAMICVKLSRLQNAIKRDSITDLAGYAATIELIIDERKRRGQEHQTP